MREGTDTNTQPGLKEEPVVSRLHQRGAGASLNTLPLRWVKGNAPQPNPTLMSEQKTEGETQSGEPYKRQPEPCVVLNPVAEKKESYFVRVTVLKCVAKLAQHPGDLRIWT